MRALVTGADGFVGARFVPYLRDRGWDVVPVNGPPHCDFANAADVHRAIATAAPFTHVFHLAAITFVPEASADPTHAVDVNCSGTIRVLHTAMETCPKARFFFVSTSEVYGPPQYLPVDEAHPLNPANPYAITKAAADAYCRYTARANDFDVVIARPFNHSGPGQSDQFALSSFAKQIAEIEAGKREAVLRVGNLSAARDFTHVDDVLRAYDLVATKGEPGEVYNICSGAAQRLQDAVDALVKLCNIDVRVEVDPERLRPVDVPEIRGTAQKISDAIAWTPQRSFQNLLQDLLDYWRTA